MKELWKEKSVKIIVAVMAVAVIGLIAGIAGKSMVQKHKFTMHINSAEKYLSELDYEQAIAEYMAALEIEPNEEAVYDALEQVYLEYAQSYVDSGDYEKAIAVLERGLSDCDREALRQMLDNAKRLLEIQRLHAAAEKGFQEAKYWVAIVDYNKILELDSGDSKAYLGLIEVYMAIGRPDLALEYAREGYRITGMEQLAEKVNELEKYEKTVLAIMELLKAENVDALNEIYDSGDVLELVDILRRSNALVDVTENDKKRTVNTYLYFEDEEKSKGGGIYLNSADRYFFYYGEYSDGKRNGDGISYYKYKGDRTDQLFHGEWANDAPNGSGKVYIRGYQRSGEPYTSLRTGMFSNGLMKGEFEFVDKDPGSEKEYIMKAYFLHGNPQGQEWPDEWWYFSIPDDEVLVAYSLGYGYYHGNPMEKWGVAGFE